MKFSFVAAPLLVGLTSAQTVGSQQTETHPKMTWKKCSGKASCTTVNGEVVIDSNWRWLHDSNGKNCYDGNEWTSACSSATDCASKCQVEGANYGTTYGASASGDALTLKFVTKHEYGTNIGSRFYLMNGATKYQMFTLMNNEFTFDVDLSTVECGINSALYFVAMDEDGGMAKYPSNKAGAKYGTGVSAPCSPSTAPLVTRNSTATPSAPAISSSSVARPTSTAGRHLATTPTPASVRTAAAVPRSTFGNPTHTHLLSHRTRARTTSTTFAKRRAAAAPTRTTGSRATVTLTAVTTTRTEWATRTSTARALRSTPAKSLLSCPSSNRTSLPSSSCKTTRRSRYPPPSGTASLATPALSLLSFARRLPLLLATVTGSRRLAVLTSSTPLCRFRWFWSCPSGTM